MDYTVISAREDPGQRIKHNNLTSGLWPEFMLHDPISNLHWQDLYTVFPEYQISVMINGEIAGIGNCIPFQWHKSLDHLPDEGWDWAVLKGFQDASKKRKLNILCGLQIGIAGKFRGKGLSYTVVEAMKKLAADSGFEYLVIPVRPNLKSRYPLIPIESYINWKDENGAPFDPWLRVHVKLGAEIIKICHKAMYIPGRIKDWEEWTNLSFQESGDYVVEGALVPVKADIAEDVAEYTEPNVWVSYQLKRNK